MIRLLLFTFLLSGVPAFDLDDVYKLTHLVVVDLFHAWQLFGPSSDGDKHGEPELPIKSMEKRLLDRMIEIERSVRFVDRKVGIANRATMQMLAMDLPTTIKYELKVTSLLENVAGIEEMYGNLKDYLRTDLDMRLSKKFGNDLDWYLDGAPEGGKVSSTYHAPVAQLESYTLANFANTVVSHAKYSVRAMMETIHSILVPSTLFSTILHRQGIFTDILNLTETNANLCNIQQSPQQLLFNLYNALQLTQLKAYTMIQFSWMLLRLYEKGNFTLESEMMQKNYIERMHLQAEEITKAMKGAKNELWRCDPNKHIPDETYTELTRLLQGFIINEVDLNEESTCMENCPYYKVAKQQGCYKDQYCRRQRPCRGKIVGCQFVDSDMWICPSPFSSSRRYDWIEYENGRTLGMKKSCKRAVDKVDSWWRWLFWHCSYCMCLCDDPTAQDTDRYFNLKPVFSTMAKNKVITGLRFVKEQRVIHLQLQEGDLLPKGGINESTVEWKPVSGYNIHDPDIKVGEDYHEMSWEQRAIDLDDLKAPEDHVLTGIRFRKLGSHLNLEIYVSKYNFTSGKLIQDGEKSQWISNDNTDATRANPRKKLSLEHPDLPTRLVMPSIPDSEHDQFLQFDHSDFDMDAAQSTIPFIDTQPVSPNPPVPLVGAGVFHKGSHSSGGFVAIKVFTLDMSSHIRDNFPEINEMRRV